MNGEYQGTYNKTSGGEEIIKENAKRKEFQDNHVFDGMIHPFSSMVRPFLNNLNGITTSAELFEGEPSLRLNIDISRTPSCFRSPSELAPCPIRQCEFSQQLRDALLPKSKEYLH